MILGLETYLGCERKEWGKERNRKTNKQVVARTRTRPTMTA